MSHQLKKFLLAWLSVLAVLVTAPAAAAFADDGVQHVGASPINTAIAQNTRDGSSIFKLAFQIAETSSTTIAPSNVAIAYANCTSCQTIAIAVQVLIVNTTQPITVITPENGAAAVNAGCTSCQTLALAYQFVIGIGQPAELTEKGMKEVESIQRQLEQLQENKQQLTIDQVRAQVSALMDQLRVVLHTELVPVNNQEGHDRGTDVSQQQEATPTPTGSASPSAAASPAQSPTPSSSASPSAAPSPSPSR